MQTLTVPADLESLAAVSEFAKRAATEANLGKQDVYRMRLAVVELATNAITHGTDRTRPAGTIELRAEADDHSLTITLEDSGLAFDPSTVPAPVDLDRPAEDRQIGGLGVYLALQSVDAFRHERVGDRNRNILVIHRAEARAAV